MVRYIKCPRCELNYIDAEKQDYCDVCLKEMKGSHDDFDDIDLDEGLDNMELCPICGENMMKIGEKMCDECKKKLEAEETEVDPEKDEEWRNYLDDDSEAIEIDTDIPVDDDTDDSEEEEEPAESLKDSSKEDDDFEYVTGDDIYNIADDDDDDDDDEDDDPDDDMDDDNDIALKKPARKNKKKNQKDDF